MKRFFLCLLCAVLLLTLSGCGRENTLSAESFRSAMETRGYAVMDLTDSQGEPSCRRVLSVTEPDSAEYRYYAMYSAGAAEKLYRRSVDQLKEDYGTIREAVLMESQDRGQDRFRMELGDCQITVFRKDSQVLYITACSASSDQVRIILRNLGY